MTLEDPLVVLVRRTGGYRIPNVILRFTALSGTLEAAPGTNYVAAEDGVAYFPHGTLHGYCCATIPDADIKGTASGQEVFVVTGPDGEAAVLYNAGQLTGAKEVTVRVDDELSEEQYNYQIRQVEFNIDGGGTSSRRPADDADDEDEDEPSVTANVPRTVSGSADGTATLTGYRRCVPQRSQLGGLGGYLPIDECREFHTVRYHFHKHAHAT